LKAIAHGLDLDPDMEFNRRSLPAATKQYLLEVRAANGSFDAAQYNLERSHNRADADSN